MGLVQMSLTGSMLIIVILLARWLAGGRLPTKVFLLLWEIAALRLLTPFVVRVSVSIPTVSAFSQRLAANPLPYGETTNPAGALLGGQSPVVNPFVQVAAVLWAVGTALLLGWAFIAYVRNRRRFSQSVPVDSAVVEEWKKAHTLLRPLQIRVSDQIASPLTYGVLRPVILLPKSMNCSDAQSVKFVLTHEWIHVRRFDAVAKLMFMAVLAFHWLNPLVWVMYILANRDMELSCDAEVLRYIGGDKRAAYATTLIDLLAQQRKSDSYLYANFTQNAMQQRIEAIMKNRKISVAAVIVAVVLTVFAMSTFAEGTNAQPKTLSSNGVYQNNGAYTDGGNCWNEGICPQDSVCQNEGYCQQEGVCWDNGAYPNNNPCGENGTCYGESHHGHRGHGSCAVYNSSMCGHRRSAGC